MEKEDVKEIYGALFIILGAVCLMTASHAGAFTPLGYVVGLAVLSGGLFEYVR